MNNINDFSWKHHLDKSDKITDFVFHGYRIVFLNVSDTENEYYYHYRLLIFNSPDPSPFLSINLISLEDSNLYAISIIDANGHNVISRDIPYFTENEFKNKSMLIFIKSIEQELSKASKEDINAFMSTYYEILCQELFRISQAIFDKKNSIDQEVKESQNLLPAPYFEEELKIVRHLKSQIHAFKYDAEQNLESTPDSDFHSILLALYRHSTDLLILATLTEQHTVMLKQYSGNYRAMSWWKVFLHIRKVTRILKQCQKSGDELTALYSHVFVHP